MKNSDKISVCIIAKNAQKSLKECLQSLKGFDEIVLLINDSSDKTLEIAKDFQKSYANLRIEKSEFIGFGALKNLCVSFAKNEWILSIDSDEILEKKAFDEIGSLSLKENELYALPRKNLYAGEWIKASGWYPDFVFRLFNKNHTKFNENLVHESVMIQKDTKKIYLKNALRHYAFNDIQGLLDKLCHYSSLYARANIHKKSSVSKAILRSIWKFFRDYFFKKGFLYGYKGFVISFCNALGVFFKYMKLYELQLKKASVSLIITTYNQKERLALVLDSVKALKYLPDELLIADDGSKPDTKELIEKYAKDFPCALRHIWQEDKGFALSEIRNKAVSASKSDYIIIVDGDMILGPHFVKDHLDFAKKGVFLQGSRVILNEDESKEILEKKAFEKAFEKRSFKAKRCSFLARLIYKSSKITASFFEKKELIKGVRGCNMSFFKEDFDKIEGFNEKFKGWGREDSEFVARFLFAGGTFRRLKFKALAFHIWHKENKKADFSANHQLYLQSLREKKIGWRDKL
ncbi:glycosyl transferase family 2 [Campylobacter sp. MIT 99-7217]|uniref:glycosyltransferase family 2 protein n=1 Tax=Campylobacter sp. MIT 99-7217 TaxID=535091 RepID=UPI00115A3D3E|nr:glycosyltransferase [Campylobacter sp. MIT 99-7217]TQR33753.1 glycosyl transferase family 2 [Campylobacter sp. MIT 99-7217]